MGALTGLFEPGGLLYGPIPIQYRITDVVTALVLAYAGVSGLRSYFVHRGGSDARYWLLAGSGMFFLAFDELLSLHERIGKALWHRGWQAPAPFEHNDDALLFMLALGGVAITAVYFRSLLEHPRAARLLLAGLLLTGGAVLLDAMALAYTLEEVVELAAAATLAAAFATRLHHLDDVPRAAEPAAALVPIEVRPPSGLTG